MGLEADVLPTESPHPPPPLLSPRCYAKRGAVQVAMDRQLTVSGAEKRDSLDLVAELTEGGTEALLLLSGGDLLTTSAAGLFLSLCWNRKIDR